MIILTEKELDDIARRVSVTAKNYITVNQHIFTTLVKQVLNCSLKEINETRFKLDKNND